MSEALRALDERHLFSSFQDQDTHAQIAAGMRSLRDGKGTDGEAFLERMEAEFDDLERQNRG